MFLTFSKNIFKKLIATKVHLFVSLILLLTFSLTLEIEPFFFNRFTSYQKSTIHKNQIFKKSQRICQKSHFKSNFSSPRDAILLYGTKLTSGLHLTIKSIRSTGSMARVILLTPKRSYFSSEDIKLLDKYKVELYDDYFIPLNQKVVPHMLRFNHELKWLMEREQDIDRILHTDSYDIFFQDDPFKNIFHDDLIFVLEPHFIRNCGWNLNWFSQCYGENITRKYHNNFIICSGSIAGSVSNYVKLLKLMTTQPEWQKCYSPSNDQPILNYLMWSGKIDEAGIKYHFTGCNGGFMTIKWCVVNDQVKFNENGYVLSPSLSIPSYLHQYNRIQSLNNYLFKTCEITT